ncbi:MAG: proprotein convertase P-domain-containing protein [Thermoflexales bacterium]|nr:proprotein convertase P-domain-containing protein [Thermoflexales bacterium]
MAALSLALVAVWVFTARSLPARPVATPLENDADAPRPDHPGEAVLFRRISLQDEKGDIPLDGLTRGVAQAKAMIQSAATGPSGGGISRMAWTWLGPGNIGGRIRSIVISPTNTNAMWIGSVSGGIWRTLDGGATWQVVDDFMANLAVSTLVLNPVTPSIMYAGTGEGFYNADGIRGAGVFKSSDGGTTWAQLASTADANWQYVNRLALSPNGATLLAATRSGTWRSIDAGLSWTQVITLETLDVNFDPTNHLKAVASGNFGRVWYSTNGGAAWTPASGITGGRVELAHAPSAPSIVYASVNASSGSIYSSTNGGQSYALVSSGSNYLGTQGWYDNVIWVDPTNPNTLIVGGIDLWRSTNGGSTLTQISQWWNSPQSAHADHHVIVHDPNFNGITNTTVYFGNDGGIYRANNVYTVAGISGWEELNNNLGITQFYGAAGNNSSGVIIGGTQDNGTPRYIGGTETWSTMFGGDGGYNAADPTNSNYFYGEYVYLRIHRSTNGGASSSYIYNGILDAQNSTANFIAPFILDPNDANRLLGGGIQLWRSNNVKATTPTWAGIKISTTNNSPISAIAVAPGNSDLIWVGHNNGDVYSTTTGTVVTPTWTRADLGTPNLPGRQVTRITIDPANTQKVYVTFGGFSADNVWRTTNGGATWSDITGSGLTGLPDVPVRSLVINPNNSNWLYVGTEVGIFASDDGGTTWTVPQDGPANVSVDELFWLNSKTLIAATHGRGLYKAVLDTVLSGNATASEVIGNNNGVIDPGETVGLRVALTNGGAIAATGVTSTLRLITGSAAAINTVSAYANIAAGATQTNTTLFTFNVNPAQPCGTALTFVFTATYDVAQTWVTTFSVPIGAVVLNAPITYTSVDVPKAVLDDNATGVTSTLSIGAAGTIGDVNVRLTSITHTWDSDLVINLTSPTGTSINLITQRGGDGDNFVNTILDDAAAAAISSGTAPFTGSYRPEGGLSSLYEQSQAGTWTLTLIDVAAGDGGTLNGWGLDIRTLTYICAPYNPTVQLSAANYNVNESAGTAIVTAALNISTATTITVNYATSNGTAVAPGDYAAASGTLTFTPGVTLSTFNVNIANDAVVENSEAFTVTLSSPSNATLAAPSSATVTIGDNDQPSVALSSATYGVSEGAGSTPITATLNQAAPYTVTVQYATSNGTASAPGDYGAASGTLTFTPGVTRTTFNVSIVNDALAENSEAFTVTLSSPSNATLAAPSSATVTIGDNDQPSVALSSATYGVSEGAGSTPITATLNQAAPYTVTVQYATSNGTATAPADYTATNGTLTFTPGVTQTTFNVAIVNDPTVENSEAFTITLSNPSNATLGAPSSATVTISDDDQPQVQFSTATYLANEGAGTALITVTLDQPAVVNVSVQYATSDDTASAGSDYTPISDTLIITAGLTTATFSVPIVNDAQFEVPEALNLALSAPVNAGLGVLSQATLTISDNDFGVFLPLINKE